jgi:hypothetical protein
MATKKQILIEKYLIPSEFIELKRIDNCYYGVDCFVKRWRNKYGELHSTFDHPAEMYYSLEGRIFKQEWYKNDLLHRDNKKPAIIYYNPNNKETSLFWYEDGEYLV